MAQLVEQSLLAPQVRGSNPVIGKLFYRTFVYCQQYSEDENKKRGWEWPILNFENAYRYSFVQTGHGFGVDGVHPGDGLNPVHFVTEIVRRHDEVKTQLPATSTPTSTTTVPAFSRKRECALKFKIKSPTFLSSSSSCSRCRYGVNRLIPDWSCCFRCERISVKRKSTGNELI